jgi:quercetin dioxygenase-like cupin family protein
LGRVVVQVEGEEHDLSTGELLVVDAGVAHDVRATEPSALLITIVKTE